MLIGSKILLVIVNPADTAISSAFTAIIPLFSVYLSSDFLTQVLTGTLNININPTNQFKGNPIKAWGSKIEKSDRNCKRINIKKDHKLHSLTRPTLHPHIPYPNTHPITSQHHLRHRKSHQITIPRLPHRHNQKHCTKT